jgi:hypothetical protein
MFLTSVDGVILKVVDQFPTKTIKGACKEDMVNTILQVEESTSLTLIQLTLSEVIFCARVTSFMQKPHKNLSI